MSPLYPSWANSVYRLALVGLAIGAVALIVGPMIYVRTPYVTKQFVPFDQPVEFDHRHHVRDDGIECLYCHPSAERAASAGVPSTDLCMGCHSQIWNDSPLLEPVRRSYFSGAPIPWTRVHDLPDFVYFHHGVHVTAGITCERCHGRVDEMPRVHKVAPLTMGWCLDCHRDPDRQIPKRMAQRSTLGATANLFGDEPSRGGEVTPLTTCSACHR